MTRTTKNSSTPVLPLMNSRQRRERPPKVLVGGQDSGSLDQQDVNLDSLSEDCRALYLLLSHKIDTVIEEVRIRDVRLEKCEEENKILKRKLTDLESRLDDVENQNRDKNLIISGGTLTSLSDNNLSFSVIQLFRQKIQYELSPDKIQAAYRVGVRSSVQSPDSRNLMLKLNDEGIKQDIISACRTVRPPDLYANDDLTPFRARLLYLLRRAKSKSNGKLVACGSSKGNVYAFIKPF